ncbi:exonuclease SbcCD subunit D C-terminal domain-containing protein [Vandammella animalimorsus]|uniref:exonuclease SbcCD subunit D C-terminal domain-containing protein n=1 Tax=Vandammella animalimorsus TaxID=2029117 RepID=UPI0031BBBE50
MKLLHTSDWHLGRNLFGRRRHEEFAAWLDWLAGTVEREAIDVLLVAGDVFDTGTPSNATQALYYRFLHRVAAARCRHAVVIAGNHDSPSLLDAPRELLQALQVHVVGQARASAEQEVLTLHDAQGQAQLIVCAVPYLRERDLRSAEPGESPQDKERKLLQGLAEHYAAVAQAALARRAALGRPVPIVAMGHLFASGGQTLDGDGVRDLYVGSLAQVGADLFSPAFDYVALGHLHVPQTVGGQAHIRYSGAPLAMGFGEAAHSKSVCLVQWASAGGGAPPGTAPSAITLLPVPRFQPLARVRGDWPAIAQQLQALGAQHPLPAPRPAAAQQLTADIEAAADAEAPPGARLWLEVLYEGQELLPDLRQRVAAATADAAIDVLRIAQPRLSAQLLAHSQADESLQTLDVHEVFERCLAAHHIPDAQRAALRQTYAQALHELQQADPQAQ